MNKYEVLEYKEEPNRFEVDLVIYHSGCNDGYASFFAAYLLLGKTAFYMPVSRYDSAPLTKGKCVAMFDFAYSLEETQLMKRNSKKFILFDHHKSAKEELAGEPNCHFDLNRAGCALAWDFFHPNVSMPTFMRFIEDRDLFRFALPESRAFSLGMHLLVSRNIKDYTDLLDISHVQKMIEYGTKRLHIEDAHIKFIAKRAVKHQFMGFKVYVVSTSTLVSEVGCFLSQDKSTDFAIIWFYVPERNVIKICLRNTPNNNVDVSTIAKKFGGGGHTSSAAFIWHKSIDALFSSHKN